MLNLWELHFMRNEVFCIISEFLGYKSKGGFAGSQVNTLSIQPVLFSGWKV